MNVSSSFNSPSFGAVLLSHWRCSSLSDCGIRNVSIASLEKKDFKFADKFIKSVDNYESTDNIKKEIIFDAAETMKRILESGENFLKKTKILIAIYNSIPCGLLIANIPKIDEYGNLVFSSRHNCAKKETELDWLATWNPNNQEKIKGIGKAIVGEYFGTIRHDKFRDIYVRSELPENSYAQTFYESMGFEAIGDKRHLLGTKTTNKSLINEPEPKNDRIIPMLITRKRISEVYKNVSEVMCRREFVRKSSDIGELIKI